MNIRLPQNPGIGGLDELTSSEESLIQELAALGDPGADRLLFWDDSAGGFRYLTLGSGLEITDDIIDVTGGGTIDGSGTSNELAYWVDSDTLGSLAVATYPSLTELSYVKGVSSAIQTQLNGKQATITFGTGVQTALGVNIGSAGAPVLLNGALGTPSSGNLANCTFPTLNQNTTGSAASLTTTRTIWGQNFNGTANVTGTLTLGTADLTLTGSIGATGARATKVWATDIESTNMPTVGGTSLTTVAQTLQNKTITNSNNVLGGVTMTLGSDADGDMYYRASNVLTRLAKGTAGQVLTMNAGATAPEWADAASGGGGWELLASVDLSGGAATSISSGTFTSKNNLFVVFKCGTTSSNNITIRFNNDSGNNYDHNRAQNFVVDGYSSNQAQISIQTTNVTQPAFLTMNIRNQPASIQKSFYGSLVRDSEYYVNFWGQYDNTADLVTRIDFFSSSGNFPTGTYLQVYGMD